MISPAWLLHILAALMLVVAAVSATASLLPGCQPAGFRRLSQPGPARSRRKRRVIYHRNLQVTEQESLRYK